MMKKWFFGKRIFPRWKLILLVIIGIWCGYMIDKEPLFALAFSIIMIMDLTSKKHKLVPLKTIR